MRTTVLALSCALPALAASAQDLQLSLPIDCDLGENCYIQNYVDHDPSERASDFRCGSLVYDGHKGTDFGLPSLTMMRAGVDVRAAASGTVRGTRNTMDDVLFTPDRAAEIDGRDCGNGVVIAHADGWETQYCHLKQGSVRVATGDVVTAGTVLGQVGLSGRTQFPHVHLSVRRNGDVVDPFDPDGEIDCAAPSTDTLWADALDTPAGGLLSVGFSARVPEYDSVKAGIAASSTLSPDGPIVLWGFAFGARPGDVVTIRFAGPDGPLFETDDVLDRKQALFFRAGGLNPPDGGWPAGTYTGEVIHSRDSQPLDRMATTIDLRP